MKARLIAFFLTLLAGLLLAGCQTARLQSASQGVNVKPAFWQVTQDQSQVYLLGSFHVLPASVKWYSPAMAEAYESSSELVVESNVDEVALNQALEEAALLPEGKTLDDYLTPEKAEELSLAFEALGLNEHTLMRFQPWFVTMILSDALMEKSGIKSEYGVDNLLIADAKQRGMKISGLENIPEIMRSLTAEPLEVQVANLNRDAPQETDASADFEEFFYAWAYGDTERLERLQVQSMSPIDYHATITERNLLWIDRIEPYLRKPQKTFIVVGAAHITGKQGLISLLEERGYKVERVQ